LIERPDGEAAKLPPVTPETVGEGFESYLQ